MAVIKMRWSEADGKVVDMTGAIRYFRSREARYLGMKVCTCVVLSPNMTSRREADYTEEQIGN